jgi:ELWxxDGT repeat protein
LLFTAADGVNGEELWKTDGTLTGTSLVKDIYPGSGDAFISDTRTALNGKLLFQVTSPGKGEEWWISDGSAAGTNLLMDICPGNCNSGTTEFEGMGDKVYFDATTGNNNYEPWVTDGTAAGTFMFKRYLSIRFLQSLRIFRYQQ